LIDTPSSTVRSGEVAPAIAKNQHSGGRGKKGHFWGFPGNGQKLGILADPPKCPKMGFSRISPKSPILAKMAILAILGFLGKWVIFRISLKLGKSEKMSIFVFFGKMGDLWKMTF
jgi:hypothetical protein